MLRKVKNLKFKVICDRQKINRHKKNIVKFGCNVNIRLSMKTFSLSYRACMPRRIRRHC